MIVTSTLWSYNKQCIYIEKAICILKDKMSSRASRSGAKPFSANRTRVDSASKITANGQAYPEIKQRGYYSDIIGTDGSDGQLDVS